MQYLQNSDGTGNDKTDNPSDQDLGVGLRPHARIPTFGPFAEQRTHDHLSVTAVNITVRLFAAARDALDRDSVDVRIDRNPPTVGSVRAALLEEHPELAAILTHSMFAVDEEYRADDHEIPPNATVVCIPPVSGG